jgi:hypothetical protein
MHLTHKVLCLKWQCALAAHDHPAAAAVVAVANAADYVT